jgi:hypothetical protein
MASPGDLSPVEVTWVDHVFRGGSYDQAAEADGLQTTVSLGYLVRADEKVVVVAQSLEGTEPHECLHLIAGCVLDVRPLKRKGKS